MWRVEEVVATGWDGESLVHHYLVGRAALLERLSVWTAGWLGLGWLTRRIASEGYVVPWDKLDLGDPEHPRLLCSPDDLERIEGQISHSRIKR